MFDNKCKLDELKPRTNRYAKFNKWLHEAAQANFLSTIHSIFITEQNGSNSTDEACKIIDEKLSSLEISNKKFADCLKDRLVRYFLKIDLGYFVDTKGKSNAKPIIVGQGESSQCATDFQDRVLKRKVNTKPLNIQRGEIAKFYESGANLPQSSFLSCSVGTGIGKSYGALQAYVNIFNDQWDKSSKGIDTTQPDDMAGAYERLLENGFTNYVFMTPQKAQIDMDKDNLEKLCLRGVQLLPVVSLSDLTSPNYVDWLTGEKNFDLYEKIFKAYKQSEPKLLVLLKSLRNDEQLLADYQKSGAKENHDAIEIIKRKLKASHRQLYEAMYETLVVEINKTKTPFKTIVINGAVAYHHYNQKLQDASRKKKPSFSKEVALFCLIKRLIPFDVCEFLPSVLVMTSQKSLAAQRKLNKGNEKKGYYVKRGLAFDDLIGSKKPSKDLLVSSNLYKSKREQMDFVRDEYLKMDTDSPYLKKGINFLIVIDELHKSYEDHFKSTFSNLINEETYLYHVLSSAATLISHADEAIAHGYTLDTINEDTEGGELYKNLIKFRNDLKHCFQERSHFSDWIDGFKLLSSFIFSGGTFEVSSKEATEITKITKNVFAFNSKLFTNLEELKSIRIAHVIGAGAKRLYFDKHGGADKNPTLYDLYQLVLAIVATGSKVKDQGFRRWIRDGGYLTNGNHHVLYDFIVKVDKVSREVSSILDQPDLREGSIPVNTLYAYFQPKATFSFTSIDALEGTDFKGNSDKIRLSFELNLINASPEVSYLRMLKGTRNVLLPLSATCGYDRIYDGNYSTRFLKKMCKVLDINYLERDSDNLSKVEKLVLDRGQYRNVKVNVIDSEALTFNRNKLSLPLQRCHRELERKVMCYVDDGKMMPLPELRNPFKKLELMRQFNNMFYCADRHENGISLSISHKYQKALSQAIQNNIEFMKANYNLEVLFPHPDKYTPDDKIQAFEFEPAKDGHRLRVILYETSLTTNIESCELSSMEQLVTLEKENTNILLIGSFGSAGTGLNNVVSYLFPDELFQEDYQNLFICGSPFYSSIKGKEPTLDSLNNFALMIKYWGDETKNHMQLSDLPLSLNTGDSLEVLTKEHELSVQKLILQCIGRIERRDSKISSTLHVPEDVVASSAFVFRNLADSSKNNKSYRIFRGLSLLGKSYAQYTIDYMNKHSFACDATRKDFEEKSKSNGQAIDNAHSTDLIYAIQKYQRTGCHKALMLNEAMRDLNCFTDPAKWMKQVEKAATTANALNVATSASMMFINESELNGVRLCEKKRNDGFELTDFKHGVNAYNPWDVIFPAYASDISNEGDVFTKEFFAQIDKMKQQAVSSGYIPSKSIIPLLRGNIGELMVKRVISDMGYEPMSIEDVERKLGTAVYERFDFFYEVEDRLYCVDAKFWSTKRDNPQLSASTTSAGKTHKPKCVIESVQATTDDNYSKIIFVYANAFYGDSVFTETNRELNHDSTVAYLNIFKKVPLYRSEFKKIKNKVSGKESLKQFQEIKCAIHVNDSLIALFNGQ
jgi:hypothetical protein